MEEWETLADERYLVKVKAKNVLYNQDEPNTDIYIVKSGRVRLSYFTSEGAEKIFMFVLEGGMFGEATCFEPTAQYFHAATIVDCELYKIPMEAFLQRLSEDKQMNFRVLEAMSHKIHLLVEQVMRLSFLDAVGRVAAVFVDLEKVFGEQLEDGSIRINLPVVQQGIANLVKTSRLTVGKVLRLLGDEGIVKKRKARFYIYKLDLLKDMTTIK